MVLLLERGGCERLRCRRVPKTVTLRRFKLSLTAAMGLFAFLFGCVQPRTTDNVISSLAGKSFEGMEGYYVHYRSQGSSRKSSILFVGNYGLNCSPYVVDVIVGDQRLEFVSIDSDLAMRSCGHEYIDTSKVKALVSQFVTYRVTLLGVDTSGNVYVNPSSQDLPTLVRVKDMTKVISAALYKPYRGDWYIKK